LKARDALIRGFPEVESVIGKAGRAETATDPAPIDMLETLVNFRPREHWPKRVLPYDDALRQTGEVLSTLEARGFIVVAPHADDRDNLINVAAQNALRRFDEAMRELAAQRYRDFERELGSMLTRFVVADTLRRMNVAATPELSDELAGTFVAVEGRRLALNPAPEVVAAMQKRMAQMLHDKGLIGDPARALRLREGSLSRTWSGLREAFGGEPRTLAAVTFAALETERSRLWDEQVKTVNRELHDRGVEAFTWYTIEELIKAAGDVALLAGAPRSAESERFAEQALQLQLGKDADTAAFAPFLDVRQACEAPFRDRVLFKQRTGGPDGDLVLDEFERVLQVPGWKNTFTQPIMNRIEMISTGIRTDVGVKVFGDDLETINKVCKEIEQALRPLSGARNVIAGEIQQKAYLDVVIDRDRAALYGLTVEDVQAEIEMALGGRVVTVTVEKRERFPVRVRYARAQREDEEAVKRLLIPARNTVPPGPGEPTMNKPGHESPFGHKPSGKRLVPLTDVADVRISEGPAKIRSENGALYNYVSLSVRGRDPIGFVDEARRVVAQKVHLPPGVHIQWTGEFEHQVKAARTLRWVLPAVILLIFIILYLTYHDLADAGLMLLAVPEALAGGAFFLYLFPKFVYGWETPPYDFSVAVWVGFIACFGMATETGIIMLVYLREAIEKRGGLQNIKSEEELRQAVLEGAVQRLRPKLLTEGVAIIAIFPMVFAAGVGAEILAPMALPVLGGLLIADEVVDIFLPVRFFWVRRARWLKLREAKAT
jgi:Cu(I)/Ag(I) efflux system membrane protein CusA/SilA